MISVTEAKKIVADNVTSLTPQRQTLSEAAYKILAEDIYASFDIPAFRQSAVDGYAFRFSDWSLNKKLPVKGKSAAGNNKKMTFEKGAAYRIFTGAPVPDGADTVVMQEKVTVENGTLTIEDEKLIQGTNVRPIGSEIKAGEPALPAGTLLTAAAIGFLAGIGITEILVYPDPSVSIIITGNELQQPGQLLQYGQVYESNSFSLTAALNRMHFHTITTYKAEDKLETVINVLQNALQQSDVVLLTGGISVGDYDFVLQAVNHCGVSQFFHKVKQRPGKPLYFGKLHNKPVFGLPGNPSSVLTCFYEYVVPAISVLTKQDNCLPVVKVPLEKSFTKTINLTQFLKGYYNGKTVSWLGAQESYRLNSFATANCLIKIDEDVMECAAGELVEIHILPV